MHTEETKVRRLERNVNIWILNQRVSHVDIFFYLTVPSFVHLTFACSLN